MSAVPSPEIPQNKQMDPVSRVKAAYAKLLAQARVSAKHTGTEGWQTLYANHAKDELDQRRDLAKRLADLSAALERGLFGEDEEKALGDVKKAAVELRAASDHWRRQTVDPVRQCVHHIDTLRINAVEDARSIENREPMLNVGLMETMKMELAKLPRVTWDDEAGRVLVEAVDGKTGEVKTE